MGLTKRKIEAATYRGRNGGACYVWDGEIPGFGVRVYPSGRKSFVVTYRVRGRQRFYTLGRFGMLTVKEAREKAIDVLAAAHRGEDPSAERMARHAAPTIAQLAERYMKEHARPNKKPRSIETDERLWRCQVLPTLSKRKVIDITRADIAALHASLAATPVSANRAVEVLSKAFNLAEAWGWRPENTNPCRHAPKYKETKRKRYLSAEELRRLAEVLAEAEREGSTPPSAVAAIRLLLLTGCRRSEIVNLRWEEVDFARGVLELADSKTGSKTVPLGAPAREILAQLPRVEGNPYVLPGPRPGRPLVSLGHYWRPLRKKAGLDDVRLHDLRHSFASVGAAGGLGLPILGALLGHTQPATTARYAHLSVDPLKQAADRIAGEIAAAMAGRAGDVEELSRKRGRSS